MSQRSARLLRVQQVVAGVIAATVLALAFLAGRYLNLGDDVIEIHGYIGNGLFVLVLANLALSFARNPDDGAGLAVAGLIALLTFAQIGLGYVGRETVDAAALHVPNGVLLMGLSAYQFGSLRHETRTLPAGGEPL